MQSLRVLQAEENREQLFLRKKGQEKKQRTLQNNLIDMEKKMRKEKERRNTASDVDEPIDPPTKNKLRENLYLNSADSCVYEVPQSQITSLQSVFGEGAR